MWVMTTKRGKDDSKADAICKVHPSKGDNS